VATVYINVNVSSVIGSVRRNPYVDNPVQLLTEAGLFINTENLFELAITTADFILKDRATVNILDRAGSTITLRG
jgi:hypothetical protein